ncbi:hypothetical protein QWY93_13040 [Echinicola jeungdonensis]|uniref:Lipoprotein n=1 Tax=Echinicola jeungdonensis TaxID=709343 RepID=A0ABV5JAP6_9BACT|nr:hypothetical protein [Echinicola jeungdonensis]MDN3670250.1 hypothetical protein [Echinicola jeungdonensis]
MKNLLLILSVTLVLGSCAVFQSKPKYEIGMEERAFLRQNKNAVISSLEGNLKTYRVVRDDRFYLLATFEDEELIKLEEKELPHHWHQGEEDNDQ